jgi:hypothetical protein
LTRALVDSYAQGVGSVAEGPVFGWFLTTVQQKFEEERGGEASGMVLGKTQIKVPNLLNLNVEPDLQCPCWEVGEYLSNNPFPKTSKNWRSGGRR